MTHDKLLYILLRKIGLIGCVFGKHFIVLDEEPNICGKCGYIK